MDKHIKSVGQEMILTYCQLLITAMKIGYGLTVLVAILATIAMPFKFAIVIAVLMTLWFTFWIIVLKFCIKLFKLDQIEYV